MMQSELITGETLIHHFECIILSTVNTKQDVWHMTEHLINFIRSQSYAMADAATEAIYRHQKEHINIDEIHRDVLRIALSGLTDIQEMRVMDRFLWGFILHMMEFVSF